MQTKYFFQHSTLNLYFFILLLDIFFIEFAPSYRLLSKTLLMPLLIIHILFFATYYHGKIKWSHFLAILFSFIGDFVLLFDLFIPGLFSFLLAHLAYIYLVYSYRPESKSLNTFLISLSLIFPSFFISKWLTSDSQTMFFPVMVYTFVILNMVYSVLSCYRYNFPLILGATLFFISDFILAFGMFKNPFPYHSSWVMLTYGVAQLSL